MCKCQMFQGNNCEWKGNLSENLSILVIFTMVESDIAVGWFQTGSMFSYSVKFAMFIWIIFSTILLLFPAISVMKKLSNHPNADIFYCNGSDYLFDRIRLEFRAIKLTQSILVRLFPGFYSAFLFALPVSKSFNKLCLYNPGRAISQSWVVGSVWLIWWS